MQVFLGFMLGMFLISGTRLGRRFERHPILLIGFSTFIAAGFYSLRVLQ